MDSGLRRPTRSASWTPGVGPAMLAENDGGGHSLHPTMPAVPGDSRIAGTRQGPGTPDPGRGLDTNSRCGSDPASGCRARSSGQWQSSRRVRCGRQLRARPVVSIARRRAVATASHRPRRVPGMRISWVVRFSQELTPREWFRRLSCVARVLCARLAAVQGLLQTSWPGHRMRLLFLPLTRRNGCWRSRTGPKAVHDTQ